MRKNIDKNNKRKIKKYKDDIKLLIDNKNYDDALLKSIKFIEEFKDNFYGYYYYIISYTNDFGKYYSLDSIKDLKKYYEISMDLSNNTLKEDLKIRYNEYINDLKEVENLYKIKKDIIGKIFIRYIYEINLNLLTEDLSLKNNSKKKIRIRYIYDLINGVFLLFCLIFNLIYRNYLLIFTVPFGIFGLINIYSFFDNNFILDKKNKRILNNNVFDLDIKKKIEDIKKEIKKTDDQLNFLYEQKSSCIIKIPESFNGSIIKYIDNDEINYSNDLKKLYIENNMLYLGKALAENTNLTLDLLLNKLEVLNDMNYSINDKNESLYMKKTTIKDKIVLFILALVSIISIYVIVKNFYELNFVSFVVSIIVGIVNVLLYNIKKCKHKNIYQTFSDVLLSTIFNSALIYDLVYECITNELKITYGIIEIPIIFLFIFSGYVMLISMIKYNKLYKKILK